MNYGLDCLPNYEFTISFKDFTDISHCYYRIYYGYYCYFRLLGFIFKSQFIIAIKKP